jgi:hypothetical protein
MLVKRSSTKLERNFFSRLKHYRNLKEWYSPWRSFTRYWCLMHTAKFERLSKQQSLTEIHKCKQKLSPPLCITDERSILVCVTLVARLLLLHESSASASIIYPWLIISTFNLKISFTWKPLMVLLMKHLETGMRIRGPWMEGRTYVSCKPAYSATV